MRKTSLGAWWIGFLAVLAGCSGGGTEDEGVSLEDATYLTALEANEDGSDEDVADATEDGPELVRGCGIKALRGSLVRRFDADGNGTLDAEEREALSEEFGGHPRRFFHFWRPQRHHRLMLLKWVYDADESGDLSDAERAELEADLEARCEARKERLLEEFDADGDGTLSDEEWVAVHDAIKERWQARRAKLLEEFDKNGDGVLDREERLAAREAIRARIQERRDALKAEFDANGDGTLDAAERAALREYLRERIRGEHWGDGG